MIDSFQKYLFLIFLFISIITNGQDDAKRLDYANMYIAKAGMGFESPSGDMADRFGSNLSFHLGLERLSASNWFVNSEFTYRFGSEVKEDVLVNFRHPTGDFLAEDGQLAVAFLRMRGAGLSLSLGKVIGLHQKSPQSGIKISVGANYTSHYIRILDENLAIRQVMGEFETAYDRLSRGFGLTEYVGYQYLSTDGNLNFSIGFEFTQVFTSGVRSVDFVTNTSNSLSRKDYLSGLKISWIVPFHSDESGDQVYY